MQGPRLGGCGGVVVFAMRSGTVQVRPKPDQPDCLIAMALHAISF